MEESYCMKGERTFLSNTPMWYPAWALFFGCVLQGIYDFSALIFIVLFFVFGFLWLTRKVERWRAVWLFLIIFSLGWVHGRFYVWESSENHLIHLSGEKLSPLTHWKGLISNAPEFKPYKPHRTKGYTRWVLEVTHWKPDGKGEWRKAEGKAYTTVSNAEAGDWHYGDEVEIEAGIKIPLKPRSPGQVNFHNYLKGQKIYYRIRAPMKSVKRIARDEGNPVYWLAFKLRGWCYRHLKTGIEDDPTATAILAGMLFGYRNEIPKEIEDEFRITGTYHIFAVSGQNVGVLLFMGILLLRIFRLNHWRWSWIWIPMLLLYCLMCGSQPSSIRAFVMACVVIASWLVYRPNQWLNSWCMALFALLVFNPLAIKDIGFLLSFSVVLALIVLAPIFAKQLEKPFLIDPMLPLKEASRWQRIKQKMGRIIAALLGGTLAAWVGAFPWIMVYFHQVSLVSPLANLIVVPAASVIVVLGTITLVTSTFSLTLAALFNKLSWCVLKVMVAGVSFFSGWDYSAVSVADTKTWLTGATPYVIVAPSRENAMALVHYQGEAWLINPGKEASVRSTVQPLLAYYGINSLEGVIVTQLTTAESSSIPKLSKVLRVKKWVLPDFVRNSRNSSRCISSLEMKNMPPLRWKGGERIEIGDGLFITALPTSLLKGRQRTNDNALVLKIEKEGKSILFAGKISEKRERLLLQENISRVDVLIQGQVMKQDSLSSAWIRRLKPLYWIKIPETNFGKIQEHRFNYLPFSEQPKVFKLRSEGSVILELKEEGWEARRFKEFRKGEMDINPYVRKFL